MQKKGRYFLMYSDLDSDGWEWRETVTIHKEDEKNWNSPKL